MSRAIAIASVIEFGFARRASTAPHVGSKASSSTRSFTESRNGVTRSRHYCASRRKKRQERGFALGYELLLPGIGISSANSTK